MLMLRMLMMRKKLMQVVACLVVVDEFWLNWLKRRERGGKYRRSHAHNIREQGREREQKRGLISLARNRKHE
jgi:hypothetical protein